MVRKYLLLISFIVPVIAGCRRSTDEAGRQELTTVQLADINRQLVIKERERIESYIARKSLDMKQTDSGLWYVVTRESSGDHPVEGDRVILDYSCSLLDGTLCYNSENNGYITLTIGRSEELTGLDEGVRLLREGSEALFILPSYLGYGLAGDRVKIPGMAVLVYQVRVVSVN